MVVDILGEIDSEAQAGGQQCVTCRWLDLQPEEERSQWQTAMSDKTRRTPAIYRAMRRHGFTGSDSAVRNHRAH